MDEENEDDEFNETRDNEDEDEEDEENYHVVNRFLQSKTKVII